MVLAVLAEHRLGSIVAIIGLVAIVLTKDSLKSLLEVLRYHGLGVIGPEPVSGYVQGSREEHENKEVANPAFRHLLVISRSQDAGSRQLSVNEHPLSVFVDDVLIVLVDNLPRVVSYEFSIAVHQVAFVINIKVSIDSLNVDCLQFHIFLLLLGNLIGFSRHSLRLLVRSALHPR